jgi:hypothetical protein
MIELRCPHCETNLKVEPARAGQTGKCPVCQGSVEVPGTRPAHTEWLEIPPAAEWIEPAAWRAPPPLPASAVGPEGSSPFMTGFGIACGILAALVLAIPVFFFLSALMAGCLSAVLGR